MKDETEVQAAISNILEIMNGADGGVGFAIFNSAMRSFEKENSPSSEQIFEIVIRFSKLLDTIIKIGISNAKI